MLTDDEEIQSEEFSKRLYSLLRERLRAYHAFEVPTGGTTQTWRRVSEALQDVTGVQIPGESLRQIANPKNKKRDQLPRDTDPERWKAIKEFLTHSSIGYVHEIELSKLSIPLRPLFSLQDFFGIEQNGDSIESQIEPTGTYFSEIETANSIEEYEVIISFDKSSGVCEALQISVLNRLDSEEEEWDRHVLEGFCLYSESGIYLIVLRDPLTFQGHVKLVLEANVVEQFMNQGKSTAAKERFINSFIALENSAWKRTKVSNEKQSESDFSFPEESYSNNTLKYIRTDASKLTLDGEV